MSEVPPDLGKTQYLSRRDLNRNLLILLCRCAESNRGPLDYESIALPTELQRHKEKYT